MEAVVTGDGYTPIRCKCGFNLNRIDGAEFVSKHLGDRKDAVAQRMVIWFGCESRNEGCRGVGLEFFEADGLTTVLTSWTEPQIP